MAILSVNPIVRVNPLTQFHLPGSTVTLHCHAEGVPKPYLSWDFNESPVPDQPEHYLILSGYHCMLASLQVLITFEHFIFEIDGEAQ